MMDMAKLKKGDFVILKGWRGSFIKEQKLQHDEIVLVSKIKNVVSGDDVEHMVLLSNCNQWERGDIRSLIDVPTRCFWKSVEKIEKKDMKKYELLLSV